MIDLNSIKKHLEHDSPAQWLHNGSKIVEDLSAEVELLRGELAKFAQCADCSGYTSMHHAQVAYHKAES